MVTQREQRWRKAWDKQAPRYDREMNFWDRHLFKDSREWVCRQAEGTALEVAIGTGLNIAHYPSQVRLIGVDASPEMLRIARSRAADSDREVDLREGDATALELDDASVDTVVCTFGLCAIPDEVAAIREMVRVLRPGGRLLLADHIAASAAPARAVQWLVERGSIPLAGEHFRRRPAERLATLGLVVERRERFGPVGVVERVAARMPAA